LLKNYYTRVKIFVKNFVHYLRLLTDLLSLDFVFVHLLVRFKLYRNFSAKIKPFAFVIAFPCLLPSSRRWRFDGAPNRLWRALVIASLWWSRQGKSL